MRKFMSTLLAITGAVVLGAQAASALPATGVGSKAAVAADAGAKAQQARWGHHHGGLGFGLGFYNYPRYRYYNNYDYDDYPRYSYYSNNYRHHRRHYCERHHRWEY